MTNIVFFGASVTEQKTGYVNKDVIYYRNHILIMILI